MSTSALLSLTARPACAQSPWQVVDSQQKVLTPNSDGSGYTLQGPTTGTKSLTGTYPDALNATTGYFVPGDGFFFIPKPSSFQGWLFTGSDGGYNRNHVWTEAQAGNGAWYKTDGTVENISGDVTANVDGTIWAIWKWNPVNQPGSLPQYPPDHIDVLLKTSVSAWASAGTYGTPPTSSGLSASATASDTFNETATASDPSNGGTGVPFVQGRHLLRVNVNPYTGLAPVSLGGFTTAKGSNSVAYGAMETYYPGYPLWFMDTNGHAITDSTAYVGATAALDTREVGITTDLEPSWYKGTFDPIHGTDRYQYIHQPQNNTVDSVYVSQTMHGITGYGSVTTYVCGAPNFVRPEYAWTNSGDGSPQNDGSALYPNEEEVVASFGHSWPANQVETTTATANVTDSDGATGTDTYTVKWHAPAENWQYKSGGEVAPVSVGMGKSPEPMHEAVYITIADQGINWWAVGQTGNGVIVTGMAVAAAAGVELTVPVAGLLAAAGVSLTDIPPPQELTFPMYGPESQFEQDVATTMTLINAGTASGFQPQIPRMSDALAKAASSSQDWDGYASGKYGVIQFNVEAFRRQYEKNYTADGYASNGYTGQVAGSVTNQGEADYIWHWSQL